MGGWLLLVAHFGLLLLILHRQRKQEEALRLIDRQQADLLAMFDRLHEAVEADLDEIKKQTAVDLSFGPEALRLAQETGKSLR